jgi:cytochrome c peroxidase
MADLPRNTPALANLRLQRWYGWGGASDSLWMASVKPILDAREFDGNPALVARLFAREPELAACYRAVFGASPLRQPQQTVVVNVGKALAAYVETLVSGRTPFDDFRDALARGDAVAAARYPADALRGLRVFIGRGRCAACHRGPNFSDGEFHPGAPTHDDGGRFDDARYLKASRFNLLGAYNDDGSRANATATRQLALHDGLRGRFRTPTLRNVAVTAPYFHDGRVDRLLDAVQHASLGTDDAQPLLVGEIDDLVAFLATLTDARGARRPWNPAGLTRCP